MAETTNAPVAPSSEGSFHWDSALTRRLRVLLHTGPLHALRASDSRRDPSLRHYDSMALALKVMDLVVEHTGLEREVDRSMLLGALSPLLVAADSAAGIPPDPARHALMIDRVLAGLRNDDEHRRPFTLAYDDFSVSPIVQRQLEFRLLADHFHPSGGIVLRLSNEAVNLYLNALELDIEDAQAAAEAVVQSQLARGKFGEAVETARNARWQSMRYQSKIEGIVRDTRRDIERVDWRDEVPRLLDSALTHIAGRLVTEDNILKTAEERLDVLDGEDERARAVAEVARLIRDCRLRHVDLHQRLMGARNVFLDEQARQAFAARPLQLRVELVTDVLEPLLRCEAVGARTVTESCYPAFLGGIAPGMLSLAELVAWQLRPRRELPETEAPLPEPDLVPYDVEVLRYPPAIHERADAILSTIEGPTTLAVLLERAHAAGEPTLAIELAALLILRQYAPEEGETTPVKVERHAGPPLRVAGLYGDNLDLTPRILPHVD
jgi:hypothetical protein